MKNNEILLILDQGANKAQYVLKVDSEITYHQLMEGIRYGIGSAFNPEQLQLFNTILDCSGDKSNKTLRELGFVTGTVLSTTGLADEWFFKTDVLTSQLFSKRYSVEEESTKKTMKYNITNRVITEMEDTVIEILSPGNPPRPGNNSIVDVIVPTIISLGTMYGLRAFFVKEAGNGMLLFMGCSVLGTLLAQAYRFDRNRKKSIRDTESWKINYENYLTRICHKIEEYQAQDILYLRECFPDIHDLIQNIEQITGVVFFSRSVNDFDFMKLTLGQSKNVPPLFTIHHEMKESIELGTTFYIDNDQIKINLIDAPQGFVDKLKKWCSAIKSRILKLPKPTQSIELNSITEKKIRYLYELSEYLAMDRYQYLKSPKPIKETEGKSGDKDQPKDKEKIEYEYPPLVLDFKNCGTLGCVAFGNAQTNLLNHIILELAAYHNPQDLQFVFFFSPKNNRGEVLDECERQKRIQNYRCLPHFNELFDGLSQFVFDEESAGTIFSRLESIMNERILEQQSQEEENITSDKYCQIVCIFEYDYKLKAKAFSKYLPNPPKPGETYINRNGLTFIFAVEYTELLPQYCGVTLYYNSEVDKNDPSCVHRYGTAQFRNQIRHRKNTSLTMKSNEESQKFEDPYIFERKEEEYRKAFAQLSAFYSLHIQERGSVPENVTLFGLYPEQLKHKIDALSNDTKATDAIDILVSFIKEQWSSSDRDSSITKELRVPIGCGESGNVYLDLHEHNDGPHMLVAGTTGSGKSEMMLTYLIGLCMRFSPQYLNLMLIDMKGNSFAGRLKELPHCVATVDNISSEKSGVSPIYMLKRFLEILKAEIKRRELIFEEYGVDKLDDYIEYEKKIHGLLEKYQSDCEELKMRYLISHEKSEKVLTNDDKAEIVNQICTLIGESLPAFKSRQQRKIKAFLEYNTFNSEKKFPPVLGHLVFVVDEFTELKRFGSETDTNYIGELTSIARVGRTLGLHMVLVSQNIENAITDDIRVNTRSRICLKVATRGASKEMLDGRTDAYYSNMPQGRAFFLVGSGSTYEYFQSGYASEPMEEISERQTRIIRLNSCGQHEVFYDSYNDNPELKKKAVSRNKDNTQLNAVIKAILCISKENAQLLRDGQNPIYRMANAVFYQPLDASIKYSEFISNNTV